MRLTQLFPDPVNDMHQQVGDFDGIAELYHENTKLFWNRRQHLYASQEDSGFNFSIDERQKMQRAFKVYELAPQIKLPSLKTLPVLDANFQETIEKRRTARHFTPIDPDLTQLSRLFNLTYGITGGVLDKEARSIQFFRATPSGGGLYPLELYAAPLRPLSAMPEGLYHFNVKDNALEKIGTGNLFDRFYDLLMTQQPGFMRHVLGEGSLLVIFSAVFSRTLGKYGQRGYRYVLYEAGHAMQNLQLTAAALGYQGFMSAAFDDDDLSDLLGLHGVEEAPLYYAIIGG
jgi:SagB-type dehydrogenase family enzyme